MEKGKRMKIDWNGKRVEWVVGLKRRKRWKRIKGENELKAEKEGWKGKGFQGEKVLKRKKGFKVKGFKREKGIKGKKESIKRG